MRYAARLAGLTAHEIKEQMGLKTREAVYRWWGGDRAPKSEHFARYAKVVKQPPAYFYQPSEPPPISEVRVEQVMAEAEEGAACGEVRDLFAARLGKDLDRMTPAERREMLWEFAEIVVARRQEAAPAVVPPGRDDQE